MATAYNLIHFKKNNHMGDPEETKFRSLIRLLNFITNRPFDETVFLISFGDGSLVYVDENPFRIAEYLKINKHFVFDSDDRKIKGMVHLQEFQSYEAAYEVALMMKEVSRFCYEPDPINN